MVQQFFDITKKELRDYELSIIAKDREMELMEDNHRVEVRVYEQKVKHLEYEHRNGMTRIAKDVEKGLGDEATTHGRYVLLVLLFLFSHSHSPSSLATKRGVK